MKPTACDRCGWPLDPAAARGGHTRHPACRATSDRADEPMLTAPASPPDPQKPPTA